MTFKEYYLQEGRFGKYMALGALATNTMFGNFVDDWSRYYQTSRDPEKEARAERVLRNNFTVPEDAREAIEIAVYIFEGDEGHSAEEFREYLEKTGAVESDYATKVQKGGGPARSYWQVEPRTAKSLVKHSSAYFGPKFHRIFGEGALELLQSLNEKQWSELLERDTVLAATMAAAKWLETEW
jgi:hypothetical protein